MYDHSGTVYSFESADVGAVLSKTEGCTKNFDHAPNAAWARCWVPDTSCDGVRDFGVAEESECESGRLPNCGPIDVHS